MSATSLIKLIIGVVLLVILIPLCTGIVAFNHQGEYMFLQSLTGHMRVKMNPGPTFKLWSRVEILKQVVTISIGDAKDKSSAQIEPIVVQFCDLGKAKLNGLVRIQLPNTEKQIIEIIRQYSGGYDHFVENGIVPVVQNAFKLAANLRGAQEAAQTLALMQQDIEDQLMFGMYVTVPITTIDTVWETNGNERIAKVEKKVLTAIARDPTGQPKRTKHILMELGCKVTSCQIGVPDFEKAVDDAIQLRREQALRTEVAKQEALRAQQEAITTEAKGRAIAMQAKWEQEKIKVEAVTAAEKDRDVAILQEVAAGHKKQALILEGEGEAKKRQLIMAADGALDKKLAAVIRIDSMYAEAVKGYQGNWVPQILMGNSDGKANNANDLIDLLKVKAAKDLSVDLSVKAK